MERHKEYLQNPTLTLREEIQENSNYISNAESSLNVHIQRIIGNFKASINYDACMSSSNVELTPTATNAHTVHVIASTECLNETLKEIGAPECTTLDEVDMSLFGTDDATERAQHDAKESTQHDAKESTQHDAKDSTQHDAKESTQHDAHNTMQKKAHNTMQKKAHNTMQKTAHNTRKDSSTSQRITLRLTALI